MTRVIYICIYIYICMYLYTGIVWYLRLAMPLGSAASWQAYFCATTCLVLWIFALFFKATESSFFSKNNWAIFGGFHKWECPKMMVYKVHTGKFHLNSWFGGTRVVVNDHVAENPWFMNEFSLISQRRSTNASISLSVACATCPGSFGHGVLVNLRKTSITSRSGLIAPLLETCWVRLKHDTTIIVYPFYDWFASVGETSRWDNYFGLWLCPFQRPRLPHF